MSTLNHHRMIDGQIAENTVFSATFFGRVPFAPEEEKWRARGERGTKIGGHFPIPFWRVWGVRPDVRWPFQFGEANILDPIVQVPQGLKAPQFAILSFQLNVDFNYLII